MKIVKTPEEAFKHETEIFLANLDCYYCPYCGELIQVAPVMIVSKHLFRATDAVLQYKCVDCGCEWQSEKFQPYSY